MSITKTEVFRKALNDTMSVAPDYIHQVSYYTDDIDSLIEDMSGMAAFGWRKFRRTEQVRVYPGDKLEEATFYIAHHLEYMPGFETELIQPLTVPNYIKILGIQPRQIAHIGVKAVRFGRADDNAILRQISGGKGTLIQKGWKRVGRKTSERYAIYSMSNFLPIKITR